MAVRKTSVVINEDLLASAQRILETSSIRETIEKAFLEVLRADARLAEIRALASMDGMELDDPEVMAGAWG